MNSSLHVFLLVLIVKIALILPVLAAYSPPGFSLDMWFIKENGVWHQFELNGPYPDEWDRPWPPLNQPNRPALKYFEQGVFHSTSTDLITWKDVGVAITIGEPGKWDDGKIASGNIVKHEGTFYLFYPGIREHPKPGECATPIGLATSRDLIHWTKHPDNPLLVPDGKHYDPLGNWRDCNFLRDEKAEVWYTVVCATAAGDGPIESRACIALAKSRDLIHWEYLPPLAVSDRYTLGMELPFLFRRGSKWYLGHSMYSSYFSKEWLAKHPEIRAEGGVYYMIADDMFGPYSIPANDRLGTQPDPPPYAVQIIDQDGDRLFMHWGPVRYATALPKKIEFMPDGLMRLVYWKGTERARKESLLQNSQSYFALEAGREQSVGIPVSDCFFEGTVSAGTAGLALGSALLISADPSTGAVTSLDPGTRQPRPGRAGRVNADGDMRIRLVADGSVVDVYADGIWMFAEHCPRPDPDQACILALDGKVSVSDIRLDRLAAGNPVRRYGFGY